MNTHTTDFNTPARRLLGDLFPDSRRVPHPYARVIELAEETPEDEITRDRRTLKRIGIGAAVAGGLAATIIHKGRVSKPVMAPALPSVAMPAAVKKVTAKVVKPRAAAVNVPPVRPPVRKVFETPARRLIEFGYDGGRDRLSKVRDGAIVAGSGAVGTGALVAGYQARKMGKKAGAYCRGLYLQGTAFMRAKRIVTRTLVSGFIKSKGKPESAALATATVLLSPREKDSKRGKFGNCLGNFSADGIHYYMIPLAHKKGEEKRFQFHLCTPAEVIARTAIAAKRGNGRKAVKVVREVKSEKTAPKARKTVKKAVKKAVTVAAPAVAAPAVAAPAVADTVPAVQG